MKAILFVVAALLISYNLNQSCTATKFCRSCHLTEDKCLSCYNKYGTPGAKQMENNKCENAIHANHKVDNCNLASPDLLNTLTTTNVGDCAECTNKWYNVDVTNKTGTEAASLKCEATAQANQTACTEIANCEKQVCVKGVTGQTNGVNACRQCVKGKKGTNTVSAGTIFIGSDDCAVAVATMEGCERQEMTNPAGTKTMVCKLCATGKAVKGDRSGCATFTGDSNCLQLDNGNTKCEVCKDGHYWQKNKCLTHTDSSGKTPAFSNINRVMIFGFIFAILNFLF